MNKNFIKLHKEIIQLKSELHQRSLKYLISKEHNVEAKDIDKAVDDVLNNVIGRKVSKRNIEALGQVNFSARIDFSIEGGLRIAEIENVTNIEPLKTFCSLIKIFCQYSCNIRGLQKTYCKRLLIYNIFLEFLTKSKNVCWILYIEFYILTIQ